MRRSRAFFEKLVQRASCELGGKATSRPWFAATVWLAVTALLGGALTALSAAPDDSPPRALDEGTEERQAAIARSGEGRRQTLAARQWTWVSGSNAGNHYGTYGTQGVGAPGNVPGGRYDFVSWKDASGNFWLFGGKGRASYSGGYLNDLWKWDISSGLWIWVSGSDKPSQGGTYGTPGVGAPGNVPGARYGAVSWTDSSGDLWLFGGYGGAAGQGYYSG
jgi:hypothetical protein